MRDYPIDAKLINDWRINYGLDIPDFEEFSDISGELKDVYYRLAAELAAERARAERAEENQSDAERIARIWMETAKKAEDELAEARRDVEQHKRAVEVLFDDDSGDLDYIKWYIRANVLKGTETARAALEGK